MTENVGTADRIARVVIGLAVLGFVFVGPKTLWGLVGLIPLITGAVGICPAYGLLGIRTCAAKRG